MSESSKSSPGHRFKEESNDEVPASQEQTVIDGWLKFRDQKKWKLRWGVVTKLSPAADCLHMQLYRDNEDRYKQGMTKASLSLEHFLGTESGFTLDKESNTIAIICRDVVVIIAFDSREKLIHWQMKIHYNLGESSQFLIQISSSPSKSKLNTGPARMHIQNYNLCLTCGVPPTLIGYWDIKHLRRYGVVDGKFCFEGGSLCGTGEGLYVFLTDECEDISWNMHMASEGNLIPKRRYMTRNMSVSGSPSRRYTQHPSDSHGFGGGSRGSNTNLPEGSSCQSLAVYEWISMDSTHDTVSEGKHHSEYSCHQSAQQNQWNEFNAVKFSKCSNFYDEVISETNYEEYDSTKDFFGSESYLDMKLPKRNTESSQNATENVPERPPKPLRYTTRVERQQTVIKSNAKVESNKKILTDESQQRVSSVTPNHRTYDQSDLYDVPKTFCTKVQSEGPGHSCACIETRNRTNQHMSTEKTNAKDYDVPSMTVPINSVCSCISKIKVIEESQECHTLKYGNTCPCQHFITCWPYSWLQLVYCRRGNTVQDTRIPFQMIERVTPKTCSDSTPLYAQVDLSKKTKYKHRSSHKTASEPPRPTQPKPKLQDMSFRDHEPNSSYTNLYFENTKELVRTVQCRPGNESVQSSVNSMCDNENRRTKFATQSNWQGENYIVMNPVCSGLQNIEQPNKAVPCSTLYNNNKLDNNCVFAEFLKLSSDKATALSRKRSDSFGSNRSISVSGYTKLQANENTRTYDDVTMKFMKSEAAVRCESKLSENRDSSSSNDSGFSFASLRSHIGEGLDSGVDQPSTISRNNSSSAIKTSLSKFADPMKHISFNFHQVYGSSTTDMPVCHQKTSHKKDSAISKSDCNSSIPFIDGQSTSSETSDISDYIETLSMSSHSSSDTASNNKLLVHHPPSSVLRPRSGKEYEKVNGIMLQE